jgi:hypothetical protein
VGQCTNGSVLAQENANALAMRFPQPLSRLVILLMLRLTGDLRNVYAPSGQLRNRPPAETDLAALIFDNS